MANKSKQLCYSRVMPYSSTLTREKDAVMMLPLKKRILQSGKENKGGLSPSKPQSPRTPKLTEKPVNTRQCTLESADESDSDLEDILQTLKKSGVRIEKKLKSKSSEKEKDSEKNVKKEDAAGNGKIQVRKQLFTADIEGNPTRPDEETPKKNDAQQLRRSGRSLLTPQRSKSPTPRKSSLKKEQRESDKKKKEVSFVGSPSPRRSNKRSRPEETVKNNLSSCAGEDIILKKKRKLSSGKSVEIKCETNDSDEDYFAEKIKRKFNDVIVPKVQFSNKTHHLVCTHDDDIIERKIAKSPSSRKAAKRAHSVKSDEINYTTPLKKRKSFDGNATECCTPENKIIRKCSTPRTPLEEARVTLHVSAVPQSLPCREHEFDNIYTFVENKLIDGIGGCMYISGVPGTGKTATVSSVISKLQEAAEKGDVPPFNYIHLNGMRLSDPRQAYVHLWQGITNNKQRISSDEAQKRLEARFSKTDAKKITTVVLVDELDLMCTKKQDVVYNLLDWPSRACSRLVVLTIANTMDMPERKLKGRVNSRLGLTRLTFLPYTHKQLEEIVVARLNGIDAFVPDAVRLVTRKVAAVSGDARRALDICRRATELPAPNESVRITHIEQAIKEMTNSNIVRIIRSCSQVEKLLLRSVADTCLRTGVEEVEILKVLEHLTSLCALEGLPRPTPTAALSVCNRLKCFRLLFTNDHRSGIHQRVTLNISQDDLHYALKVKV